MDIEAKSQLAQHHQFRTNKLDTLLSSQKTPAHQHAAARPRFGACVSQPDATRANRAFPAGPEGRSAGLVTAPRGARSVRRLADRNQVTRASSPGSNRPPCNARDLGKVPSGATAAQPRATNGHVARALVHAGNGPARHARHQRRRPLTASRPTAPDRGAASPSSRRTASCDPGCTSSSAPDGCPPVARRRNIAL